MVEGPDWVWVAVPRCASRATSAHLVEQGGKIWRPHHRQDIPPPLLGKEIRATIRHPLDRLVSVFFLFKGHYKLLKDGPMVVHLFEKWLAREPVERPAFGIEVWSQSEFLHGCTRYPDTLTRLEDAGPTMRAVNQSRRAMAPSRPLGMFYEGKFVLERALEVLDRRDFDELGYERELPDGQA
jgi:hypothetical protein